MIAIAISFFPKKKNLLVMENKKPFLYVGWTLDPQWNKKPGEQKYWSWRL